ncbi:MAG: endonuclease/exonuclease/phosphatase family protein [Myxococcota bacterium]
MKRVAGMAVLLLLAGACTANDTTFYAPALVTCADNTLAAPPTVRFASYNVKSGLHTSLEEVATELESIRPDVVALQEVDVGVDRTHRVDEAQFFAERLGLQALFAAAIERGGGAYGVAMLTRFPVQAARRVELRAFGSYEPRVAIDAELCLAKTPLHFVAVHADFLNPGANAETLARHIQGYVGKGLVVAGDLNATPSEEAPRKLTGKGLFDLFLTAERPTFWPSQTRLDYVFVDAPLAAQLIEAKVGEVKASDHFPIWVDVRVPSGLSPGP